MALERELVTVSDSLATRIFPTGGKNFGSRPPSYSYRINRSFWRNCVDSVGNVLAQPRVAGPEIPGTFLMGFWKEGYRP